MEVVSFRKAVKSSKRPTSKLQKNVKFQDPTSPSRANFGAWFLDFLWSLDAWSLELSALAQTLDGFFKIQPVRLRENSWNFRRERTAAQHAVQRRPLSRRNRFRDFRGVLAREPMFRLAEQVVAHFRPVQQPERLRVGPQPQNFHHVDLP